MKPTYKIKATHKTGLGSVQIQMKPVVNFAIYTNGLSRKNHKLFLNSLLYFDPKDPDNFSVPAGVKFLKKSGFEVELKYYPENDPREKNPGIIEGMN